MSARFLYQRCVGEGGMDVRHFMRRLTYAEADDYLGGLERRYRTAWECAQMLGNIVARAAGCRKDVVGRMPWQRQERDTAPPTEDDMEALRRFRERVERKTAKDGGHA